jgi:hypothetical protein
LTFKKEAGLRLNVNPGSYKKSFGANILKGEVSAFLSPEFRYAGNQAYAAVLLPAIMRLLSLPGLWA